MAFHEVKGGFQGWREMKPEKLTRTKFKNLQPNTVLADSYIQGRIISKWNVHKFKNSHLLKIAIQEVVNDTDTPTLGTQKLAVFIIGDVVDKWMKVSIGDFVCLNEVDVELGPNDGCRISLEDKSGSQRPRTWWLSKDSVELAMAADQTNTTRSTVTQDTAADKTKTTSPTQAKTADQTRTTSSTVTQATAADQTKTTSSTITQATAADQTKTTRPSVTQAKTNNQTKTTSVSQTKTTRPTVTQATIANQTNTTSVTKTRTVDQTKTTSVTQTKTTNTTNSQSKNAKPTVGQATAANTSQIKPGSSSNNAAQKKTTKATREYTYTQLQDIRKDSTVNVWGVVKYFRPPSRSKGTDFSAFISLTDSSLIGREARVSCLLFDKEPKLLPDITTVGQIVRFHRLRVTEFNGKLQGRSGPGFSWLLFDYKSDSNEPLSASSPNYSFNDGDKKKLKDLRGWLQSDACPITLPLNPPQVLTTATTAGSSIDPPSTTDATTASPTVPSPGPTVPNHDYAVPSTSTAPAPQPAINTSAVYRTPSPTAAGIPGIKYTTINEFKPNCTYNVMGVITFIKAAKRTARKDFLQIISIVDHSISKYSKLKCLLFADRRENLLNDALLGQVICFHNLNIIKFGRDLQGQRGVGFCWAIFDCLPTTQMKKIKSNKDDFVLSVSAQDEMNSLRLWAELHNLLLYQRTQTLADIEPDQYFDFICQVVATCVLEPDVCILLRVWDGSLPLLPIYNADLSAAHLKLDSDPTLLDVAQQYISDVFIFDDHFTSAACLKPSDYVLLTNLHAMRHKPTDGSLSDHASLPQVELCLHGGTKFSRGLRLMDSSLDLIAQSLKDNLYNRPVSDDGMTSSNDDHENEEEESEKGEKDGAASKTNTIEGEPKNKSLKRSAKEMTGSPGTEGSKQGAPARKVQRKEPENSTDSDVIRQRQLGSSQGSRGTNKSVQEEEEVNNETSSNEHPRCVQQTATVIIGHHHIETIPVKNVVQTPAPCKFRVKVQLIGYHPKANCALNDLYCLHCTKCNHFMEHVHATRSMTKLAAVVCPLCKGTTNSQGVEMERVMRLTLFLADETGWIKAFLVGDHAERFFSTRMKYRFKTSQIFHLLNTLCPTLQDDPSLPIHGRPWMECCVLSYRRGRETFFQLFDTMLAVETDSL